MALNDKKDKLFESRNLMIRYILDGVGPVAEFDIILNLRRLLLV